MLKQFALGIPTNRYVARQPEFNEGNGPLEQHQRYAGRSVFGSAPAPFSVHNPNPYAYPGAMDWSDNDSNDGESVLSVDSGSMLEWRSKGAGTNDDSSVTAQFRVKTVSRVQSVSGPCCARATA